MTAGLATEYSELVLQTHHIVLTGVQELGGPSVFFESLVVYLQSDRGWIVVVTIAVGHRHDGGV
jgi:hypothetical protein